MDCDGDVVCFELPSKGIGMRKGVCPSICESLYVRCMDALFYYDLTRTPSRLKVCENDSLICSPLKDLVKIPQEACEVFGFKQNEREFYEESLFSKIRLKINVTKDDLSNEAACYNGNPESKIYGVAPLMGSTSKSTNIMPLMALIIIRNILNFL